MNEKEVKNRMVKKSKIFGLRYLEKMNKNPAVQGKAIRVIRIDVSYTATYGGWWAGPWPDYQGLDYS